VHSQYADLRWFTIEAERKTKKRAETLIRRMSKEKKGPRSSRMILVFKGTNGAQGNQQNGYQRKPFSSFPDPPIKQTHFPV